MLRHIQLFLGIASIVIGGFGFAPFARAETFVLKSGGRIDGELLNRERGPTDPYLVKTDAGTIKLTRDVVSKTVAKSNALDEYQQRAPKAANTVEAQWEIAQWCQENSLSGPRAHHLRQILAIDPDHKAARIGLGYERFEGRWMKPDEYNASIGYRRYKGAYRSEQDIALLQQKEIATAATVDWRNKLRIWRKSEGKKREAESIAAIRQIRDPAAMAILCEYARDDESQTWRILFIETIGQFPAGSGGDSTLADLALNDSDGEIREKALDILERIGSQIAVRQFVAALKSQDNATINRAGRALARMRDLDSVPALIAALKSTHSFTVQQGGGMGAGFTTDGTGQQNLGSFGAGGGKKTIKQTVDNEGVLEALVVISGENHGYDRDAWRRSHAQAAAPANLDLRRGG